MYVRTCGGQISIIIIYLDVKNIIERSIVVTRIFFVIHVLPSFLHVFTLQNFAFCAVCSASMTYQFHLACRKRLHKLITLISA
jgi:hypothetical protein